MSNRYPFGSVNPKVTLPKAVKEHYTHVTREGIYELTDETDRMALVLDERRLGVDIDRMCWRLATAGCFL